MIEIHSVMKRLASRRPIFHSEADLKFAFAWELQMAYPQAKVRVEWVPPRGEYEWNGSLDVWAREGDDLPEVIELKYHIRKTSTIYEGEVFELKDNNVGSFDLIEPYQDVQKLHDLIVEPDRCEYPARGRAIWLTNLPEDWFVTARTAKAANVRRTWVEGGALDPRTFPKKYEGWDIRFPTGRYHVHWHPFRSVEGAQNGVFRYSMVDVIRDTD